MELQTWILTLLVISTIHGICTWKLYVTANRKAWEAFVPIYNGVVLMEIINRPKWWMFLIFIPVINLLLLPAIWIETLRSFGKKSSVDMVLGVATLGLYIGYVNYTQTVTHEPKRSLTPATKTLDTLGSLAFALIVATLVHTYIIQPFVIPTSSLEQTLLKGDFLFVSKFHYGARVHKTPIAAPMVHDTIPFVNVKSYIAPPELPYFRLPGVSKVQRNDIVCFNWPCDSSFHMYKNADKFYYKPIDKKTNYVKRCVAIPNDNFEIKNSVVFINGKPSILPERAKAQEAYTAFSSKGVNARLFEKAEARDYQKYYSVAFENQEQIDAFTKMYGNNASKEADGRFGFQTDAAGVNINFINKYKLDISEITPLQRTVSLTKKGLEILRKTEGIDSVIQSIEKPEGIRSDIFPGDKTWTKDNMGPFTIPAAGVTVQLNANNISLYKRVIKEYEGNSFEYKNGIIKINNQVATSYTFKQNYYWMMGDNRGNSLDARYWGFTPEDHLVGKPVFVWLSVDGIEKGLKNISNWRPRWDRMFTVVHGEGMPKSYFREFLVLLAIYLGIDYYLKRKKKKQNEEA